ncbi:hypothetical protein ACFX19_020262 [Malus domestica]
MGDPLGSSRLSSQKQNREGMIGAQNGQYRATEEMGPRIWWSIGRDVSSQKQNREGMIGAQNGQYRATEEMGPRIWWSIGRDVTIMLRSHVGYTSNGVVVLSLMLVF